MLKFHLFPRLPLELRQTIWELAIEPREVVVGGQLRRRLRTPIPAILIACTEAWTHLQKFYTKSFPTGTPPKFSWVNFDIDTVYCSVGELACCSNELDLIQRLIVECTDSDFFYYDSSPRLARAKALDTVTILHFGLGAVHESWWREWDDLLQGWYYRDDPVRFYTKVISIDDPSSFEINTNNYLRIERDWRRNNPPPPEEWPDYQVSDSDDDVDAEWRYRKSYIHVDGCNCPSRQAG
jgi:hypothetical protein